MRAAALGAGLAALWLLCAPGAEAAKTREAQGTFGSAAQPAFAKAMGMAVELSSGDLLVIDVSAKTLSRFKPNGEAAPFSALGTNAIDGKRTGAVNECPTVPADCDQTPQNGLNGFGGSPREMQVAVDNSCALHEPPLSGSACESAYPSDGNIYLTQSPSKLIDIFSREGDYLGQLTKFGATNLGEACGVAVDGEGAVYVGDYNNSEIHKYVPTGEKPLNTDNSANFSQGTTEVEHPCQLAAGAASTEGSLFASEFFAPVSRLDASTGSPEGVLNEGIQTTTLAVDPTTGYVVVADHSQISEYNDSGTPIYEPIVFGNFEHEVRGLALGPDGTLYLARRDTPNVKQYSPLVEVPPRIEAQWAVSVGSEEAALEARFGPEEQQTTYHVEYLSEAEYEANGGGFAGPHAPKRAPVPDAGVGTAREVGATIKGLSPGTTYRWRFLATDPAGTSHGPDSTLRTYRPPEALAGCPNAALRSGLAANLPDCRAYEMVSPIDKNGGGIVAYEFEGFDADLRFLGLDQATPGGEKLAYSSFATFAGALGSPLASEYIATRAGSGWQTEAINPPMGGGPAGPLGEYSQYKAFSEDLSQGWLKTESRLPLTAGPTGNSKNLYQLYRRDNAGGAYAWLHSSATPEPEPCADPECPAPFLWPELQGFSADGNCAVFRVNDALPGTGAPHGVLAKTGFAAMQTYLWCEGRQPRLVSTLPNGTPYAGDSSAGTDTGSAVGLFEVEGWSGGRTATVEHALSADGTRLYWSTVVKPPGVGAKPGDLFLRVNAEKAEETTYSGGKCVDPTKACTLPVSEAGFEDLNQSQFWTASPDGGRAIYSITAGETAKIGNLYQYEYKPAEGKGTSTLIAGKTLGVAGSSKDATRVYLASEEDCSSEPDEEGEEPQPGEPNLYLYEAGESCSAGDFDFIGTLAGGDVSVGGDEGGGHPSPLAAVPRDHIARASSDGEHLAFVSEAKLTSYDNTDVVSGKPDREVYLYDAATGRMICPSCNPGGARPRGADLDSGGAAPLWTAAWIPGYQNELYGRRMLSAGGDRLFFNSLDSLALRDANGAQDVYQWEAPGTGTCTTASPTYSPQNGGCVDLISSGQSPEDSEFVDASSAGEDVFIRTAKSLVGADPGSVDIYDAKVEGGFAEAEGAIPCEGDSCQSVPGAPAFTSPASGSFEGPGNPAPSANCTAPGRRAQSLGKRAKRLRHAAKRAARRGERRKAARLGRKGARLAHRAKALRNRARRCRRVAK